MTEQRWTVDEDGWLISPSGRTAIASWDHDDAEDASARIRTDEFDALVAAVRDADTLHQALAILADLIDDEPCSFDHHGYCQTHCWLQEGECPVKRGRDLLAAVPDPGAEP